MKKIIFGITSLTLGGAERVLVDIANRLIEQYDVTIFTLYSNGELEKELDSKVHLISLYNKRYDELTRKEKILIPISVLMNKKAIYKKYIDNDNYISQIAFLEGAITRIFSVKSKNKDCNKLAWIHNDISRVFGNNIKSKIKRLFDRSVYEKYNTLVFVSIDNLDKFNKVYDDIKLPHERVINNYIDAERIIKLSKEKHEAIFNNNEINILQVSRLVEQKAIDRLIEVHTKLIKNGHKHHIYIIGDGPLRKKLEEQIDKANVQDTFTLLGANKNPYPYIKDADAFCLFSKFEGYPMVLEEAKILRKFIATTNTSSREVLINYPNNSMIVENDDSGIEEAIKFIINNKNKIVQADNVYVYDNNRTIDKIIKTIEEGIK